MARFGVAWLGLPRHGTAWILRPGSAWQGMARPGKARCGLDFEAWQGTARYGTARLGTARLGFRGMARQGKARFGVAWLGFRGFGRGLVTPAMRSTQRRRCGYKKARRSLRCAGPFQTEFLQSPDSSPGKSLRRIGNAIVSEISIHSVTGAAMKHVRTLIDQARSLGLEAIPERGGSHFKLRLSDGQRRSTLVVSGSPSCRRAAKNNLSALKRFASGHNLFH